MLKQSMTGLLLAAATIWVAPAVSQQPITADARDSAVRSIAEAISNEFYDAERAAQISADMVAALDGGEFSAIEDGDVLAAELSRRLGQEDTHFGVNYIGPQAVIDAMARFEQEADQPGSTDPWATARRANFGFASVEILPGNIGYIELTQFAYLEPARDTAIAALNFIANTDAVIFDLRQNRGGSPTMVQFLTSHFLASGGGTLINTFVSRDTEYPTQMWSLPTHPAGNRPETPLYVLISSSTGSAAEGFPYHLRAMERATLVGETTYGAGNPGGEFYLDEGYTIFISTGSARNPITQSNWESVGVEPHVAVSADTALEEAMMLAYTELAENTEDPLTERSLTWALEALAVQLNPITISVDDMQRYVGDFGLRDISVVDGQLMYQREGAEPVALVAFGNDRFGFPGDDGARITFRFDRRGRAEAMDLLLIGGRVIANPIAN
jgi:hypothetical protein